MAKVLVTGATGFIGKRLTAALLKAGHDVYVLVRIKGTHLFSEEPDNLHILYGDLRNPDLMLDIPTDIDVAYYLMHSMGDAKNSLSTVEKSVAENFVKAIQRTQIRQIIFLGGIIHKEAPSDHLKSRLLVEDVLKSSMIPITIFRASIIIGAGSASFEIIRDLVEKLPVMVAPKWINSLCQPIAIRDVLYYLQQAILNPKCLNQTFDIGGPDTLTFKQAMLQYADVRHLNRYIFTVPVLTPRLSSYWLVFVTSVRFSLASYLVDSMICNTDCQDQRIQEVLPRICIPYKEAIRLALLRISEGQVASTWMDAWQIHSQDPDIHQFVEVPTEGVFTDEQIRSIQGPPEEVLKKIWSIGGEKGWYALDWAWDLRGLIDKLVGGVGMNRGRRSQTEIYPGDSIDFWRVIKADKKSRHLILYAEMKTPGEAWLEFKINDTKNGPQLVQKATFRPKGFLGRGYWYFFFPFHYFIFGRMANALIKKEE